MRQIVAVSARPELALLVARWRVEAFWAGSGMTVERMTSLILAPPPGPHEAFVALEDGTPVATAAVVEADLETRPDLTPWLAAVYTLPSHRGRGHATALVREGEHHAAAAGVTTLWLYTRTAEPLYARLGWQRASLETEGAQTVALMRRDLVV